MNESKQKYEQLEKIGEGEFGKVFKAIKKETKEYVALKRMYRNNPKIRENVEYFEEVLNRELENMEKCKCQNIVGVYERIDDDDSYVIVMELCDISLSDYIDKKIQRPLSIDEIYDIFSNLNYAFKKMQNNKIVHRDLKNENIILKFTNEEKTKFIPKICDFGFSKKIEDFTKTFLGSEKTMAPEIIKGFGYDSKVDLWSIGIMIYYCCFREYPYNGQKLDNLKKNKKVPYNKNIFLDDLIEKLLVIDPNNRITWKDYFSHPFFTLSSFKEIDIGFKNDNLHYYKAKYKEENNKYQTVLIKEIYQNNLGTKSIDNDYEKHFKFIKNNNILKIFTLKKMKDSKNNTIIYLIYYFNENCEPLNIYCKNHNFTENEIQSFINDFVDIFKNIDDYINIFISIYSFVVYPNEDGGPNILLCDFGLNKYFLSEEEMKIYYAPNKEENINECPSKTRLMNFGITILKMINNNEDNIFYENNNFVLNYKKPVSEEITNILEKCLCKDIKERPNWNDLILKEETLLNEKQFEILIDNLLTKYRTINEYYSKININNMKYISENEDFILLSIYEINKIRKILSDKKEFTRGRYEISFLKILNNVVNDDNKVESQLFSLNSKNCLDIYLINDVLNPEKKANFIHEINQIYDDLIKIIIEIEKKTGDEKFSIIKNNINDDYFETLLKQFGRSKFHNFFFSFIHKFENNNKKDNIDLNKVCLELSLCKYIGETLLFIKEGIKSSNDFKSKRYKTKEELFKDIEDIFSEDNGDENRKKFILISLFCGGVRNNYDFIEHSNLEKDNDKAIETIIKFYPNILKLINFVKNKK